MPSLEPLVPRLAKLREAILAGADHLSEFREMPFAIFVYAPAEEFALRTELKALFGDLRRQGLEPIHLSVAKLAYDAVAAAHAEDGGWDAIYSGERRKRNPKSAVQTVRHILAAEGRLADRIAAELATTDPARAIVFLGRAGALYPSCRSNAILSALAGRIKTPTILLYSGKRHADGGLEWLDTLPSDASAYARIF